MRPRFIKLIVVFFSLAAISLSCSAQQNWDSFLPSLTEKRAYPLIRVPSDRVLLRQGLKHESWIVRYNSLQDYGYLGRRAESDAKYVIPLLADPNEQVAELAYKTLRELGRIDKSSVNEVDSLLRSSNSAVKLRALSIVGTLGRDARSLVPQIVNLLDDNSVEVRTEAQQFLTSTELDISPELALAWKEAPESRKTSIAEIVRLRSGGSELR